MRTGPTAKALNVRTPPRCREAAAPGLARGALALAALTLVVSPNPALATEGSPDWVVAAHKSLFLGDGALVFGDVAAQDEATPPCLADDAEVTLGAGTTIHGSVWGDTVSLRGTPAIDGVAHYLTALSPAPSTFPAGATEGALALPLELLDFEAPEFPDDTPEAPVTVTAGATLELDGGIYEAVTLVAGTTGSPTVLRLAGENYAFGSLTLGDHTRVELTQPGSILIGTRLQAGDDVRIGASYADGVNASDAVLLVLGQNGTTGALGDDPPAVSFGEDAALNAMMWAPNGTIRFDEDAYVRGVVLGKWTQLGAGAVLTRPGLGCGFGHMPEQAECDDRNGCTTDSCSASGVCANESTGQSGCAPFEGFAFPQNAYIAFDDRTSTAVTLTWTAAEPENDLSHYELRQDGVFIAVVAAPDRSWRATGLATGTYTFEVTAIDFGGMPSAPLSPQPFNVADTFAPVWPLPALTIHAHTTSADLDWPPAWDDVGIQRYHVIVDGEPVTGDGISDTSFHLGGLSLGEIYDVAILVEDTAGNLQEDGPSGTIILVDTERPTWDNAQLTGTIGSSGLELTWSGATDNVGVQSYYVVIYEDSVIADAAWVAEPVSFPYLFPVAAATEYGVLVYACDGYPLSACTANPLSLALGSAAPDTQPPTWPDPSVVNAAALTPRAEAFSWPSASDPSGVIGYRIYDDQDEVVAECVNAFDRHCGDASEPVGVDDLEPSTFYEFHLAAVDAGGYESDDGPHFSFTTLPPDATWDSGNPGVTATPMSQTDLLLDWPLGSCPYDSVSYEVTVVPVDPETPGGYLRQFASPYTETEVTDLTPGATYEVTVVLRDDHGYPSDEPLVTTVTMPYWFTDPAGAWPPSAWLTADRGDPISDVILQWSPTTASTRYAYKLTVTRDDDDSLVLTDVYPLDETSVTLSSLMPLAAHTFHLRLLDTLTQATSEDEVTATLGALPFSALPASWPVAESLTVERVDSPTGIVAHWSALTPPSRYGFRLAARRAGATTSPPTTAVYPAGTTSATLAIPTMESSSPYYVSLYLYDFATGSTSIAKLTATVDRVWPAESRHLGRFQAVAADAAREWREHLAALGTPQAQDEARARCRAMGLRGGSPSFTTNARGLYTAISGCELALQTPADPGSSAEEVARAFLADSSELFGIVPADLDTRVTFPLVNSRPQRDGSERVTLSQRIGGLRVFTSRITLVVRNGRITKVGGNLTPPDAVAELSTGVSQAFAESVAADAASADPAAGFTVEDGIYDRVSTGGAATGALRAWRIRVHGRLTKPDVYIDRATGRVLVLNERASPMKWGDLSPEARQVEAYSQRVRPRAEPLTSAPQAVDCAENSSAVGAEFSFGLSSGPVYVVPEMLQYSTLVHPLPESENECSFEHASPDKFPYTYCAEANGDVADSCGPSDAVECRASSCSDTGDLLADTLKQVGAFYFEWTGRVGWDDDVTSSDHRIRALTDFGEDRSPCCGKIDQGFCSELPTATCPSDSQPSCCEGDPTVQCSLPQILGGGSGGDTGPGRWIEEGRVLALTSNLLRDDQGVLIGDDDGFQYTVAHELCHGIEFAEAQQLDPGQGGDGSQPPEISHLWVHEGVADMMGVLRQAYEKEQVCGAPPDWYLGLKCGDAAGEDGPDCPCEFVGDDKPNKHLDSFADRDLSFQFSDPLHAPEDPAPPAYLPLHLTQVARTTGLADNPRLITKIGQLLGDPPSDPLVGPAYLHHGIEVPNIGMVPWGYPDLTRLFLDTLLGLNDTTLTAFRESLIAEAASLTSLDPLDPPDCSIVCSKETACGSGPVCNGAQTCVLTPTCDTEPSCSNAPACEVDASPVDTSPKCPTPQALAASADIVAMVRAATDSVGLWTAQQQIGEAGNAGDEAWVPASSDVTTARLGTRRYIFWIDGDGAFAYKTRECSFDAEVSASCPAAVDHAPLPYSVVSFALATRQHGQDGQDSPGQLFFLLLLGTSGSLANTMLCWFDEAGTIHEAPYPIYGGVEATTGDPVAMAIQGAFLYLFYREHDPSTPANLRVARLDLDSAPWMSDPSPELGWHVLEGTPEIEATTGISATSVPADVTATALAGHISVAFGSETGTLGLESDPYAASALTIWNFDPTTPQSADLSYWRARNYDSRACIIPEIEGRPLIAWFRGYLHFAVRTDILRTPDQGEVLTDAQGQPLTPAEVADLLQDPGIVYGRNRDPLDPVLDCPEPSETFGHWATPWTLETAKSDRPSMLDVEPEVPGEQSARLMLWSIPAATGLIRPTLRSKSSD